MNKCIAVLVLLLSLNGLISSQVSEPTHQIMFKIKKELTPSLSGIEDLERNIGLSILDQINHTYSVLKVQRIILSHRNHEIMYVARFPEGINIEDVLKAYEDSGEIEIAEPDFIGSGAGGRGISPNDQYYSRQWGLYNDGTFVQWSAKAGADVDMQHAWEIEQGSSSIVVAIIDSGIKLHHPELEGRIWQNADEAIDEVDNDANDYKDDYQGWDFANADNDPSDDYGHGSNIAGILGANGNNDIGYAGIDWNCKIMALKALDGNNLGYYSWFTAAVFYAVENGAKVINMSLGGTSNSGLLQNAIHYATIHGVTVVASMMNTNSDQLFYPAAFPDVMAVGSTDPDDNRTDPFFWDDLSGSNYGDHISVVAPGNIIYGLDFSADDNFDLYWGGTSQATPFVTGLASLLMSQDPNRTPLEVRAIIEGTADDQVGKASEDKPGWDRYYGYGRINAYNALSFSTAVEQPYDDHPNSFVISPNPSNGNFKISADLPFEKIEIVNLFGQIVYSSHLYKTKETTIHLPLIGLFAVKLSAASQTSVKWIRVND